MAQRWYPAVLEKTADGFNLFFPDFEGCVSGGDTADEAVRNGAEALALHVEDWAEQGWNLPQPSGLDGPLPPEAEPVARVLVPLETPRKLRRVNVTLQDHLLDRIDREAEQRGQTRSGFLAEGTRRLLSAG